MSRDGTIQPDPPKQGGPRGIRRWVMLGAIGLLVSSTFLDGAPRTRPHNFGITDGSVHEDPRDAMRSGDFPTWKVSQELPNDVFTFARLRYTSASGGRSY